MAQGIINAVLETAEANDATEVKDNEIVSDNTIIEENDMEIK